LVENIIGWNTYFAGRVSAALAATLLVLTATATASGGDEVVARAGQGTAIRSFDGWSAWLSLDAAAKTSTLVVRAPDGTMTTTPEHVAAPDVLNVDPEAIPFDLGPGPGGRPTLVFGACTRARSCAVFTSVLPSGAPALVAGTASATRPGSVTIWGSQVAWTTPSRSAGTVIRLISRPGASPRTLVPWAARQCAEGEEAMVCGRTRLGVGELELRGKLLASVVGFDLRDQEGEGTTEIGLLDLDTGHRDPLDVTIQGEGGEVLLAPAFTSATTLEWLRACEGDPGGCVAHAGVVTRNLDTGAMTLAPITGDHSGWAPLGGGRILLAPSADTCAGDGSGGCAIEQRVLRASVPCPARL
jgi:hypothetical protein